MVTRVVTDAGATIIDRGTDGAGHRKITFRHHDQERTFHYPCTGRSRGHGIKNTEQRLKWLLNGIQPAQSRSFPPPVQVFPPPVVLGRVAADAAKASRIKLTKERRSQIVKRYSMTGVTIDTIMREFSLSHTTAETLLLATLGAVRSKYIKERNLRRAQAARGRETDLTLERHKRRYHRRGALISRSQIEARNRRIFVYHQYGMTLDEIAQTIGLTHERVRQIVRAMEKEAGDVR